MQVLSTQIEVCFDYWTLRTKTDLGLNLKKTGIFSNGPSIPWFGIAVTNDVRSFITPPISFSRLAANVAAVLLVKSIPWNIQLQWKLNLPAILELIFIKEMESRSMQYHKTNYINRVRTYPIIIGSGNLPILDRLHLRPAQQQNTRVPGCYCKGLLIQSCLCHNMCSQMVHTLLSHGFDMSGALMHLHWLFQKSVV